MADNQPPMPPDVSGPADTLSPPPPPPVITAAPDGEHLFEVAAPPPPPPPPPSDEQASEVTLAAVAPPSADGPPSSSPSLSDPPIEFSEPPVAMTPPLEFSEPPVSMTPTLELSRPPVSTAPPLELSEPPVSTAPQRPAPPATSSGPPAPAVTPFALPDLRAPAPFEAPSASDLTKPPRRRRRGLIAVVVVLILLIAGGGTAGFLLTRSPASKAGPTTSGGSGGGSANPTASGAQATAQPTPSAVSYTDPDLYYTAQFDSAPKYHSTSQSSPAGNVPYRYAEYVGPDVDQLVGVLVFSPGTSFDTTKGLQGIASAGSGSVISSAPSTFQGYPSLEGVINLQGDYLKVQIVHVGNLAYIIGTAGPVNPPSDYARFLSTVHITPH